MSRNTPVFLMIAGSCIAAAAHAQTCTEYAKSLGIPRDAATGVIAYQGVVQVEGATAADLFARARVAVVGLYKSAKDVTQLEDKDNGRIIVKGNYQLPRDTMAALGGAPPDRVRHTLTIECKDGRYRITLSDLIFDFAPLHNSVANVPGHSFPFDEYVGNHSCFGKKTLIKHAHEGALEPLKSAKAEMAKTSPVGTDKW